MLFLSRSFPRNFSSCLRVAFVTVCASVAALSVGAQAQPMSERDTARDGHPEAHFQRPVVKKPKPIHTEFGGGLRLNTDGWSAFLEKGFIHSDNPKTIDMFSNQTLIQLEFSEHQDPKQEKQTNELVSNNGPENTKPFVFGKIINFYSVKLGYGFRRLIAGKPEPHNVSIHWVGVGGFALGLKKPYYVDVYSFATSQVETIKYTPADRADFLNSQYIFGASGFTKGLGEITFAPGLHAKSALHFDWAASRKSVAAVEAGVDAEYYFSKVEIMADQKPKSFFVNLYASIQFGHRW